jgi:hypothetical protein
MMNWLQTWFESHCDSNWEHGLGIKIETIDNPGWSIQIDLDGTDVLLEEQNWTLLEQSDTSWIGYKVENNIFFASGDPQKLELLILIFKMIIENGTVENSDVIRKMKEDS